MNSLITFIMLATVLGMASTNLSLPLVSDAGQIAAPQGVVTGFNSFMVLCLSVTGLGFVLAFKSK